MTIVFEHLFAETHGKPIRYNGRLLVLFDLFDLRSHDRIILKFQSVDSPWKQGVSLRCRSGGELYVNGVRLTHMVCWHDLSRTECEISIIGEPKYIEVKNVWDSGNGVIDSWHNGAAMYIEDIDHGKKYYCNDGFADDDLNDLIFTLQLARGASGRTGFES